MLYQLSYLAERGKGSEVGSGGYPGAMTETPPELHPFAEAPATLELRKESWKKQTLDVVGGDRSFGRIDYGMWSGKGKAEALGAAWLFSAPKGFTGRRVDIQRGDGTEVGDIDLKTWSRGGTFELVGARYELSAAGILKERWAWERDGVELVALQESGSLGQAKGTIELSAAGREDPNGGLLTLLAIHLKHSSDASSAASTSAIFAST